MTTLFTNVADKNLENPFGIERSRLYKLPDITIHKLYNGVNNIAQPQLYTFLKPGQIIALLERIDDKNDELFQKSIPHDEVIIYLKKFIRGGVECIAEDVTSDTQSEITTKESYIPFFSGLHLNPEYFSGKNSINIDDIAKNITQELTNRIRKIGSGQHQRCKEIAEHADIAFNARRVPPYFNQPRPLIGPYTKEKRLDALMERLKTYAASTQVIIKK